MLKLSKDLVNAVKEFYAHLEKMAWDNASPCVLSFVKPNMVKPE